MKRIAVIAIVLASLALPVLAADPPTTVFLVRHAEKESTGDDPSLSQMGRARAEALAGVLADAGITAVYTSEFKRTQETAAPIAKRLGVTVTVIPGKDVDGLVAKLRALPPGAKALVVGHSNTIPVVAQKLTGAKVAELTDADFDRLVVATLGADGTGAVSTLHYGR